MILRSFCLAVSLLCAPAVFAQTPGVMGDVSDKTVKTLKALAWQALPTRIVALQSDRITVEIDKADPAKVVVPDADAREIIREAQLTARASRCDLRDLVIANRDALLLREKRTGRWTETQLQYINVLHLITVQLLLGKMEAVDAMPSAGDSSAAACNEKEKQEISGAVKANENLPGKS